MVLWLSPSLERFRSSEEGKKLVQVKPEAKSDQKPADLLGKDSLKNHDNSIPGKFSSNFSEKNADINDQRKKKELESIKLQDSPQDDIDESKMKFNNDSTLRDDGRADIGAFSPVQKFRDQKKSVVFEDYEKLMERIRHEGKLRKNSQEVGHSPGLLITVQAKQDSPQDKEENEKEIEANLPKQKKTIAVRDEALYQSMLNYDLTSPNFENFSGDRKEMNGLAENQIEKRVKVFGRKNN